MSQLQHREVSTVFVNQWAAIEEKQDEDKYMIGFRNAQETRNSVGLRDTEGCCYNSQGVKEQRQ